MRPGSSTSSTIDTDVTMASDAPPPPFALGMSFGPMPPGYVFASRYRIDRVLGTGGMGAVYQAWDQQLDIPVALKIIRPDITADATAARDFEQRFKQELLTARQVSHRNVIRIHDLGEHERVMYITMQFVKGSDLDAILTQGQIPFERTLNFARQLASGLAAAHDVGIIHRDLKPKNILVDAADTAYISDFGLARSTETTMAGLTRTGEIVGTPRYISPEQVQGKPADQRSDLYALGTIFFEMASGQQPFSGKSMIELMYQRVQEMPRDINALKPELPQYFRNVVMRCLERDPDKRYANARELLRDLESEQAVGPVSLPAGRTVSITLPLPTTRRSKVGVGVALIAVIGLGGFAVRQYFLTPRDVSTAVAVVPTKFVAVLPFQVVGDATTIAPLAAGVEEALSSKLFELPSINVASSTAVERAVTRKTQAEIARELGVTLLVTGTVQGNGENLRVTVALDDVPQGKRLWSQDFSGLTADLLTIEDQIYARLLTALNVSLTSEQTARAISHPTENIEAYRLYLAGRNAMRGQQKIENVKAALGFFEQAAQKDASFARAYAGISDGSIRMFRTTRDRAWIDKALSAAQQARNLDDKLVEAHLSLGSVYQETGKASEAIAELTLASELAPNSDDVFRRLGRVYLETGRGPESIQAYDRAIKANPYYWVSYSNFARASIRLGDYPAAVTALKKVIELEPTNVAGHNDLGATYLYMGQFDDAAAAFKKALEIQPTAPTYTNLGTAYAYNGKLTDAIPMFEKAVSLSPNTHAWVGNLADGYRWAGQKDQATATYDKAIALALADIKVNPKNAAARGNLAMYYAKKGDHAQAGRMIASARAIDASNVDLMYAEAIVNNLAGRPADALTSLTAALKAGYPFASARNDPDLRSVATDPGLQTLVKELATKK